MLARSVARVPLTPLPTSLRRRFPGGFFSMADRRKRLHRQLMDELANEHDVLETVIPTSADVERMGAERAALVDFAPRSRAARAYADLWEEIRGRLT